MAATIYGRINMLYAIAPEGVTLHNGPPTDLGDQNQLPIVGPEVSYDDPQPDGTMSLSAPIVFSNIPAGTTITHYCLWLNDYVMVIRELPTPEVYTNAGEFVIDSATLSVDNL